MDVKTAFLHGDLKEDIFISIPDGFNKIPNMVCKLNKTLYGLSHLGSGIINLIHILKA